jgi:hypothetical protein
MFASLIYTDVQSLFTKDSVPLLIISISKNRVPAIFDNISFTKPSLHHNVINPISVNLYVHDPSHVFSLLKGRMKDTGILDKQVKSKIS